MKVVYNSCFGGFSISRKCAVWMADRCHAEAIKILKDEPFYGGFDGSRHDALLVMAVEELGDAAAGSAARLRIHALRGSKYFIREYDGSETVIEPDDIRWIEV